MNRLDTFLELPVEVEFDYSPGCDEKLFGENVHPAEPAAIEITEVRYSSTEIIDIETIDKIALADIERQIWDQIAAGKGEDNERD